MAVTIIQDPQYIQPAYNTIAFTVDSDNKTECNFRYICDVYINGVYVTRLTQFPFGVDGYATFKVNRVIEDYVSYDIQRDLYGVSLNPNSITGYQMKFGEEYDVSVNCDAGVVLYADLTISSLFLAWNSAFQYVDFQSFDYTDYEMDASTKSWLTHRPTIGTYTGTSGLDLAFVGENQQYVLNFFNINSNIVNEIEIKTYTFPSTLVGTYRFTNLYAALTPGIFPEDLLLSVGAGPVNLNATTLSFGVQPIITSAIDAYTVRLYTSPGVYVSDNAIFLVDHRCTMFDPITLWWLNRLGGFDSYTFTQLNTRRVGINREEYSKLYGELSGSPVAWTYDIGDRGRVVSSVKAQEEISVRSNWVGEAEGAWLEELFTSPEVYNVTVNGWEPVVITSSSFETKLKSSVKNIDYTVSFAPANPLNIQRN